jgi:hypothetical protein
MRGHSTSVSLPCVTVIARTIKPVLSQASHRTYGQSNGLEVKERIHNGLQSIFVPLQVLCLQEVSHTWHNSGTTQQHTCRYALFKRTVSNECRK